MNQSNLQRCRMCLLLTILMLLAACSSVERTVEQSAYTFNGQGEHWGIDHYYVTLNDDETTWGDGGIIHYIGSADDLKRVTHFEVHIYVENGSEPERVHAKSIVHGPEAGSLYDDIQLDNLNIGTVERQTMDNVEDVHSVYAIVKWGTHSDLKEEKIDLELISGGQIVRTVLENIDNQD